MQVENVRFSCLLRQMPRRRIEWTWRKRETLISLGIHIRDEHSWELLRPFLSNGCFAFGFTQVFWLAARQGKTLAILTCLQLTTCFLWIFVVWFRIIYNSCALHRYLWNNVFMWLKTAVIKERRWQQSQREKVTAVTKREGIINQSSSTVVWSRQLYSEGGGACGFAAARPCSCWYFYHFNFIFGRLVLTERTWSNLVLLLF